VATIKLHPLVIIDEKSISWKFARSSGPGGQHVNKTETKAILEWNYAEAGLREEVLATLNQKLPASHSKTGTINISSDNYRSQRRNIDACMQKLRNILDIALKKQKKRKPTKPSRASKEKRITEKKRKSDRKAQRKVNYD